MIKKHKALLAYMLALAVFTTYVVMDTFVITRVYSEASGEGAEASMQIEQDADDTDSTENNEAAAESGKSAADSMAREAARADLIQAAGDPGAKAAGPVAARAAPAPHPPQMARMTERLLRAAARRRHLLRQPAARSWRTATATARCRSNTGNIR